MFSYEGRHNPGGKPEVGESGGIHMSMSKIVFFKENQTVEI